MKRYVSIWFPHLLTDWLVTRKPALKDQVFVFTTTVKGRVTITAASKEAERFINNLRVNLSLLKISSNFVIHIVNGILFEIYFNSKGEFRKSNKFKSNKIDDVFEIFSVDKFKTSIDFIKDELLEFNDKLIFIPNENPEIINFDVEVQFDPIKNYYKLKSFKFAQKELFNEIISYDDEYIIQNRKIDKNQFEKEISKALCIPLNLINFKFNVNLDFNDKIYLPIEKTFII